MGTNRFGFSMLSKHRYNEAYLEEVLVDKNTGEFLVKGTDGRILSYDYNTKIRNIHNNIKNIMHNNNLYGDVYPCMLQGTDKNFPIIVKRDDVFNSNDVVLTTPTKRFILYIDIDGVGETHNNFVYPASNVCADDIQLHPTTTIQVTLEDGNGNKIYRGGGYPANSPISKTNNTILIYNTDEGEENYRVTKIKFNSLAFNNSHKYNALILNYIGIIAEA